MSPQAAESPKQLVERIIESGDSGEVVVASDRAEIHVYLQHGRVAWITSPKGRQAFTKYLVEDCGIGTEAFRDMVNLCRRTGKNLGESLVFLDLATEEQIRNALLYQIRAGMESLDDVTEARAVFLPKASMFENYDERFTFTLADIHPPADVLGREPAADESGGESGGRRAELGFDDLLEIISGTLPDILWCRLTLDGEQLSHRQVAGGEPTPLAVLKPAGEMLKNHIHTAIMRSNSGFLMVHEMDGGIGHLWSAMGPDAELGDVLAALSNHMSRSSRAAPEFSAGDRYIFEGDDAVLPSAEPLETALEGSDELLCVEVYDPARKIGARVRRESFDPERLDDISRQGVETLQAPIFDGFPTHGMIDSMMAFDQKTIQMGDDRCWYYGALLVASQPRFVLLAFPRSSMQSFGWALLATLARQVGRLFTE